MAVPAAWQSWVDRFRRYINDTRALNFLFRNVSDSGHESADDLLYELLEDSLDHFNNSIGYPTTFTVGTWPSWDLVKKGAVLQYLTSKGILSARNTLNWSDPSGLNIRDQDQWGRYINYFNVLVSKYYQNATNIKVAANINACYDNVESEYANYNNPWAP